MANATPLSVLTLNCWGLKFVSKEREARLGQIGKYLAEATNPGYDIVGLQEVWVYQDYLRIRDMVRETLPYSKHWSSGVLGSGLVILSKYPIVGSMMRRFALNGDPFKVFHGDWYVGKCCVSATIAHPTCGEIEIFNTHLHAGYDPVGTLDSYLGCRVGEAWEMSGLVKAATTQGRHVISLGDYNSAPDSLVVQLLTRQGGLTDSWERLHPAPRDPIPSGLTPEEGVSIMGVTCDTPLNSWSGHTWINHWTKDPIGERLDYIFYRETPELSCTQVNVAVREKIPGMGAKNYSDHYGVHAMFSLKPAVYHFENRKTLSWSDSLLSVGTAALGAVSSPVTSSVTATTLEGEIGLKENKISIETLEEILSLLQFYRARTAARCKIDLFVWAPLMLLGSLGLSIGFFWIEPRWVVFLLSLVVCGLSAGWMVHFLYGFLYAGETDSSFANVIQEVQTVLDARLNERALSSSGSRASSSRGGRGGLLK